MTYLDIYLLPGKSVLGFVLQVFQLPFSEAEPVLFNILSGFVAWIIWMALIKAAWTVTLRLFGFYPPRGQR